MSKAFIELRSRTRKYKLDASDIGKLYKISKRKTPSIPSFDGKQTLLSETDDDGQLSCENTL